MKTTKRSILVLLCAAALSSCDENAVQEIAAPFTDGALVKFFNFGVSAPAVNFYANDAKVTAVLSTSGTESTSGVAYGGVGGRSDTYSAIAAGQYTLQGKIAGANDKDLAISNLSATLADGKRYSFYQSGFYDGTAKTVDAFIVEDPFVDEIDYTVAYVRFVNAIANADAMTLYAKHSVTEVEAAVGGAVAYKSAGAFTALPVGVYDLSTRYTGSDTNVISRADVSFESGRVYTIGARGDITVVSTSAADRPILDNTTNR